MIQAFVISFQKVGIPQIRDVNPRPAEWLGWENYTKVFENDIFWSSLRNTLVFAAVTVEPHLIVGTARRGAAQPAQQADVHVPDRRHHVRVGGPPVAQGVIWRWLFDAEAGIINWALNLLPDFLSNALFGRADWTGQPWTQRGVHHPADPGHDGALVVVPVRRRLGPGRPQGHPRGALRGGPGRRLEPVADVLEDHVPAAEARSSRS